MNYVHDFQLPKRKERNWVPLKYTHIRLVSGLMCKKKNQTCQLILPSSQQQKSRRSAKSTTLLRSGRELSSQGRPLPQTLETVERIQRLTTSEQKPGHRSRRQDTQTGDGTPEARFQPVWELETAEDGPVLGGPPTLSWAFPPSRSSRWVSEKMSLSLLAREGGNGHRKHTQSILFFLACLPSREIPPESNTRAR